MATSQARADLALETETARVIEPGEIKAGAAFEFQTASEGQEYAVPLVFEVGLYKNLELLIEPVAVASIQGETESATGFGDIEVTLNYRFVEERSYLPALSLAGEIKFPSATNEQIGSGKFDYRIFGVASKRVGDFDLHWNLGYTFIGSPSGTRTKDPIDAAFAAEWFLTPKFDLVAEVTYIGSSLRASSTPPAPGGEPLAEIGGKEIVGSLGGRFHFNERLDLFGTFSYDNNNASLIRTGVSLRF